MSTEPLPGPTRARSDRSDSNDRDDVLGGDAAPSLDGATDIWTHKLTGAQREEARIILCESLLDHNGADAEKWVSKDVSLILEVPEPDGANAPRRKVLQEMSNIRQTWLAFAANMFNGSYQRLVQVALEAGVHPDDARVFRVPLITYPGWASHPERLALLLGHGAGRRVPWALASALRKVLIDIAHTVSYHSSIDHHPRAQGLFASAEMLILAGSGPGDMPELTMASGVGLLSCGRGAKAGPSLDAALSALVRRLHSVGADLKLRGSPDALPLLVLAVESGDIAIAETLIELGAHEEGFDPLEAIQKKMGEAGRARLAAAMIRRRLMESVDSSAASGPDKTMPSNLRRARSRDI